MNYFLQCIQRFFVGLIIVCCGTTASNAQTWNQILSNHMAGYSVFISGDYAVLGDNGEAEDALGLNPVYHAGAVYIVHNNSGNWELVKKIVAPVRAEGDAFGSSVSMSGDYVIVGAPQESEDALELNTMVGSGSAYVFRKNKDGNDSWGFVKKITASIRAAGDNFGGAVSISGNYATVGAPYEDEDALESNNAYDTGSAYIFMKDSGDPDNWVQVKKITATQRTPAGKFGISLSMDGDYLLVGAPWEPYDGAGANFLSAAGGAFLYKKEVGGSADWELVKKLTSFPRDGVAQFGYSVCIKGEQVIVGTYLANSGTASVFGKDEGSSNNWGQVKKISKGGDPVGDYFGSSVAIDGEHVAIGAHLAPYDVLPVTKYNSTEYYFQFGGAVYMYERANGGANNWGFLKILRAADPVIGGRFGFSISISGDYTLIGSTVGFAGDTPSQALSENGSMYIFKEQSCNKAVDMVIPTAAGIYQSSNTIQDGSLTYFCDCANNYLLLALDLTASGSWIKDDGVKMKVGTGASYYPSGTGFVSATQGAVFFNRWWNVNTRYQPTVGQTVKVRTYYIPADYNAVNTILTANSQPAMTSESKMTFYKVLNQSLGDFPAITDISASNVKIITHGSTPAVSNWVDGNDGENKFAEFKVSSFSGGGGGSYLTTSLPVNLVDFKVSKGEGRAFIGWITSEESNADFFEIQKSNDGRAWEVLGKVSSSGESKQLKPYSYVDFNPSGGENLYRLKMIDLDGSFAYSNIKSVTFDNYPKIAIYPNPVSDKLYFPPGQVAGIESVRLINNSGIVVGRFTKIGIAGISTAHLAQGLYIVQVIQKDGTTYHEKVVLSR